MDCPQKADKVVDEETLLDSIHMLEESEGKVEWESEEE